MKKLFTSLLITVFTFSLLVPSFANASENESSHITMENILSLEPYVNVEEGLFVINIEDALKDGVDESLLNGQEEYFKFLNNQIKDNKIKATENLEIINNEKVYDLPNNHLNEGISTLAKKVCRGINSGPKYYWWGYKTYLDSCNTETFGNQLQTYGAGTSIGSGAASVIAAVIFPPAAIAGGVATITSGWCALLGSRIIANNTNGKGVIADITYAGVFDISPQY